MLLWYLSIRSDEAEEELQCETFKRLRNVSNAEFSFSIKLWFIIVNKSYTPLIRGVKHSFLSIRPSDAVYLIPSAITCMLSYLCFFCHSLSSFFYFFLSLVTIVW